MKRLILILEQQSWCGGAQRVLDVVLRSIEQDFEPVVAFPERGPFSAALQARHIETLTLPLGKYPPGRKSYRDMMAFALRTLFCTVKIASIIHRKRISLVYINGPRCLPAGVAAAWLMRRPSLFHLHLILTQKSAIVLARHCARHVTKIVACSDAAAESLLSADRRLVAKLDVFHNPTLARVRRVCRICFPRTPPTQEVLPRRPCDQIPHRRQNDIPARSSLPGEAFALSRKLKSRSPGCSDGVPRRLCSSRPRKARRAQSAANSSGPRA